MFLIYGVLFYLLLYSPFMLEYGCYRFPFFVTEFFGCTFFCQKFYLSFICWTCFITPLSILEFCFSHLFLWPVRHMGAWRGVWVSLVVSALKGSLFCCCHNSSSFSVVTWPSASWFSSSVLFNQGLFHQLLPSLYSQKLLKGHVCLPRCPPFLSWCLPDLALSGPGRGSGVQTPAHLSVGICCSVSLLLI